MDEILLKTIEELMMDIVDTKIEVMMKENEEIKSLKNSMDICKEDLYLLMNKLEESERNLIDDYLSMHNNLENLMLCNIYTSGYYDCIALLKELGIL